MFHLAAAGGAENNQPVMGKQLPRSVILTRVHAAADLALITASRCFVDQ
jgi:hypothetical protein